MFYNVQTYPYTKESIDLLFNNKNKFCSYNIYNSIKRDILIQSVIVASLGVLLYANPVFASGLGSIDKVGNKFLNYARQVGYWSCLVMSIVSIVKSSLEDNPFGCWKKVLGYLFAFASLYFLPDLFDGIKGM